MSSAATTTISCPACSARNRVPVASSGKPRCGKCKRDLPWLSEVGDADFDAVVGSSSLPILVDLWAPWCGPCRMVAPSLEQLAAERAGRLRVVKVNVDESPLVAERLGVQGIPTMVLYMGGRDVARQVGALPLDGIRSWVDSSLATAA
jgi:thioredoxin 2